MPTKTRPVHPVKAARFRKGWTLRDLQNACVVAGHPVSYSALSKIERGVTRPRPGTLATLARVLGVDDPDMLLPQQTLAP
jgi:transcriptional regulator with XRE-family HTH domain